MSGLERKGSTKAIKPRTAWTISVLKGKSGYEVQILWKETRNKVGLFVTKGKGPFGRLRSAKIVTEENNRKEVHDYYRFVNEFGDVGKFRVSMMEVFLGGSNPFSKKLNDLRSEKNDKKVALLLSHLVCSRDFIGHDPNVYNHLGQKLGEAEQQDDFEEVFAAARDCATIVTAGYDEAIGSIAEKTKRNKTSKKAIKLNKQQRIEKFFIKENADEKGVEKEYIHGIKGRLDIRIEKLTVSEKIQLPISETEIRNLANDMVDTFDITQMYFVVMPADPDSFDEDNLEKNSYEVLHGRHRLLSLQLLIKENKISLLPGMENRSVPCLILGTLSVAAANWVNLRNSDIAARYVFRPNHHDLVYELHGLKKLTGEGAHVLETVTRYCNMLKKSDAEKAALRALSRFPQDALEMVVEILKQYEKCQTADFDEKMIKKSSSKLTKGEKLITPMAIFKPLTLMPLEYLKECCPKILDGKLSLKDFVSKFSKENKRRKKEGRIEEIAGFKTIVNLRNQYPQKFTPEILDKLCDTPEPKPGPSSASQKAVSQLESYTRSVVESAAEVHRLPSVDNLRKIDLQNDIKELKGLTNRAKSNRIKGVLSKVVQDFETELVEYEKAVATEEYSFPTGTVGETSDMDLTSDKTDNHETEDTGDEEAPEDSESEEDEEVSEETNEVFSRSLLASQVDGHFDLKTDTNNSLLSLGSWTCTALSADSRTRPSKRLCKVTSQAGG